MAFTVGVTPLQQYLIAFPDGRLQALGIAWDSRLASEGGQRRFHLYPDQAVSHRDQLHWTRPQQNWNYMCAGCHSTGLQKGYDPATDRFDTTWAEIDVGCEACYGPGSQHVAWAALEEAARDGAPDKGLSIELEEPQPWPLDPGTGSARPRPPEDDIHGPAAREIEMCAACYSRRGQIAGSGVTHQNFLDVYRPALLSDCQEPHSLALRAPGDSVCAQCHLPSRFASEAHHQPGSAGASCLDCRMPESTYMVVDPRRDHSLRVPRPDRSVALGIPNACNDCHRDRTAEWAAALYRAWYPDAGGGEQVWAEAGRLLAGLPAASLPADDGTAWRRAVADYEATQAFNADRPDAQINLALLYLQRGKPSRARGALERAIELDPDYVPAYANLADLARSQHDEAAAVGILERGLTEAPDAAALHHALGLTRVRLGQHDAAMSALERAATLDPDSARFAYVYAVTLNGAGRSQVALATLRRALDQNPTIANCCSPWPPCRGMPVSCRQPGRRHNACAPSTATTPKPSRWGAPLACLEFLWHAAYRSSSVPSRPI